MKTCLHTLVIAFLALCLYACASSKPSIDTTRATEREEWEKLLKALDAEDWKTAALLSGQFVQQKNTDPQLARLRYMHIYAIAGQVGERQIERKDALKAVKVHEGKMIMTPRHPLKDCIFNCIWKPKEVTGNDSLFTSASNKAGIFIHCFEFYKLLKGVNIENYQGKTGRFTGTLESIELQGVSLSAFKLTVKEAELEVIQE